MHNPSLVGRALHKKNVDNNQSDLQFSKLGFSAYVPTTPVQGGLKGECWNNKHRARKTSHTEARNRTPKLVFLFLGQSWHTIWSLLETTVQMTTNISWRRFYCHKHSQPLTGSIDFISTRKDSGRASNGAGEAEPPYHSTQLYVNVWLKD